MKQSFRKSKLTKFVITALLSGMYAQSSFSSQPTVTVGVDGSFTTSNEGNTIKELVDKKINDLKNDKSLTQYTIAKEGEENSEGKISPNEDGSYMPRKNGEYVTKDTLVTINSGDKIIEDGSTMEGFVYGGYSQNDDVKNINVIVNGATLLGGEQLYGAYTNGSQTTAKGSVFIYNDSTLNGIVVGADSYSGSSYGDVYVIGGNVSSIEGANSGSIAIGNVYIIDGNTGAIRGASSLFGKATGNVFIEGGSFNSLTGANGGMETEANIYLFGKINVTGEDSSIDVAPHEYTIMDASVKGLLSMASSPLTVNTLQNVTQYNFYINEYNKDVVGDENSALLRATDYFGNQGIYYVNDDQTEMYYRLVQSKVKLAGISKKEMYKDKATIVLIDATGTENRESGPDGIGTSFFDTFATQEGDTDEVDVGLMGKADVTYHIIDKDDEKKVTATIDNYQEIYKPTLNKNLKPLAEGRLTTLENAVRSAEALQDIMGEHKPIGTFTPIAEISGGVNQYDGNTEIESRDYRLIVGSRYQILDNLYAGIALDYGRSNYNSDNGNKRGEGNTYNYGASLFSKYTDSLALGDVYFDGALRLGRTSTDMKSNDIITSNNEFAGYKSRVNYVGANTGLGFIYKLNEKSSFDTSTHYYWTRLGSDNISIDGDDIHFSNTNSSKVQFKEQYNYKTTDNLTFTLAGVYEYEFDSKAGASSSGVSIDAPSMQGSTKIVELGIKGTPIAESKDFNFNLKFRGYAGKRNGASASAFFEYDF